MLMNSQLLASTSTRLVPRTQGVSRFIDRIAGLVDAWTERRRSRADLAQLDARLLRDIGLTPSEASGEAAVPFWKG